MKTAIDDRPRTLAAIGMTLIMLLTLSAWSCNSTWLQIVQQDLPVLTKQATSIAQLVDPSGSDAKLATTVGSDAVSLIGLVSDAYAAYNQSPTADTLQKLRVALDTVGTKLPETLQSVAGQFSNPTDLLIVTAAVDAIVTTVDIIANQIPGATKSAARAAHLHKMKAAGRDVKKIPTADDLRKQWNSQVCSLAPGRCPTM